MTADPAAAGPCPGSAVDGCVIVTLTGPEGRTVLVTGSDIRAWAAEAGEHNPDYDIRRVPGGPVEDRVTATSALPVRDLIEHLTRPGAALDGLRPSDVTIVKLPHPQNDYISTLGKADLGPAGSGGFADGLEPVVYLADSDAVSYIRPLRPGTDDVNGDDDLRPGGRIALELTLSTTGRVLTPEITVTPAHPSVGQKVRFRADVPGAPYPSRLTYRWQLGSAGAADPQNPATASATWTTKGGRTIGLVVTDDRDSYGRALASFTVGDAPPPTETPTVPVQPGGGGGKGDGNGESKGPPGGRHATPGGPGTDGAPGPTGPPAPGSTATTSPTPAPDPDPDDGTVRGLLLSSGTTTGGADAPAPTEGPATSSTVVPPKHPFRIATGVWFALLAGLLVLVGAAGELRDVLRTRKATS
ncbi:hypothetical protein [Pimelobacter simplex]|uniref:hypothetical protein n=1 Tax=Nocardioides simplex TaxID=2045 RepID=UPI003AAC882C